MESFFFLLLLREVYVGVEFFWPMTEEKKNCVLRAVLTVLGIEGGFCPNSGGFRLAFAVTCLFSFSVWLFSFLHFSFGVYKSVTFVPTLTFLP